jgi:CRP-like cAMP-binding protein
LDSPASIHAVAEFAQASPSSALQRPLASSGALSESYPRGQSPQRQNLASRLACIFARECGPSSTIKIARQDVIYSQGQQDPDIYFIEFGQVKSVISTPSGRNCLVSIRGIGDVLGELCLLYPARRETAIAMKSTRLRRVPVARFRAALVAANLFDEFVLYLLMRISDQQGVIANMVTMNSEQRLAATMLELAAKIGTRRGEATYINDRITQEELAAMVGTTRSRVGLFLKKFRDRGMIISDNPAVVVDENLLRRYLQMA